MPNVEEVARLRVSITGATEAQIQRLEEQINALEEQMLKKVTAEGNSTTGTYRPFGLDCSGFADWVFYNISGGSYILGHGGGAHAQHTYCTPITWAEAQPGDLVFFNDPSRNAGKACSHAGIYVGGGQIIHSSSSRSGGVIYSDLTSGYYNTYFIGGIHM